MIKKLLFITFLHALFSCQETSDIDGMNASTLALLEKSKEIQTKGEKLHQDIRDRNNLGGAAQDRQNFLDQIHDDEFVNLEKLSSYFVLNMKYATEDNFLKEKVYDCAKCYVRGSVAKALVNANKDFMKKGYRIQLFDCYRPHSVQKKMWEIYPDPGYVANPKGGSVHNRGAAVDITLTDLKGNPLNMGTDFDHFGKEAHHSYTELGTKVIANRKLLRKTMEAHGFSIIKTEWWHYNYTAGKKYAVSDFRWDCEE